MLDILFYYQCVSFVRENFPKMAQKRKRIFQLQRAGKASANLRSGIQKGPPASQSQDEGVFLDFTTYFRDTRFIAMPFLAYFRWEVSQVWCLSSCPWRCSVCIASVVQVSPGCRVVRGIRDNFCSGGISWGSSMEAALI
jgi:hypothetical protein